MNIYEYVLKNHIPTPIKLEIGIDKVAFDRRHYGNDARYMRTFINGVEVTGMVAEAVGLGLSRARDTRGCLIIHGTGMDMGFALQNELHSVAYVEGYPDMFDRDYYTYLGKLSHGEYPYKRVA